MSQYNVMAVDRLHHRFRAKQSQPFTITSCVKVTAVRGEVTVMWKAAGFSMSHH